MKNKLIYILLPIVSLIIIFISYNYNLYSFSDINKNSKIIIYSNNERIINIKNKYNKSIIYNFYITSNNYEDSSIFVNNKEISNGSIKSNNNILYTIVMKNKSSKAISIKILSNKKEKYLVYVNKLKYNQSIISYLKSKATKNNYFVDTDSAKEMYKFGKEYKYVGIVPNNYLIYNNQLWRIIGTEIINSKEYLKIIKNNVEKNYNIYGETNDKKYILTKKDYINSFKKVNRKCVRNIYKCNTKSYLTPTTDELIDDNGKVSILTSNGNIIRKNNGYLYRKVLYLNSDNLVGGGDGNLNRPYFLK